MISEKTGYGDAGHSIWVETKTADDGQEILQKIEDSLDEDKLLNREEIMKKYEVYKTAAEYLVDPEELTDSIIEGINSNRFDPFANIVRYSREEWEKRMTEHYGEEWKNWWFWQIFSGTGIHAIVQFLRAAN